MKRRKRLAKTIREYVLIQGTITKGEADQLKDWQERKPFRLRSNYNRQTAALNLLKSRW